MKLPVLLALLGATFLAAAVGAVGSTTAPWFYAALDRPDWAPPASVFGPVWTVLYLLMAIAAWLAVRAQGWPAARPLVLLYLVQLVLNALWSWFFFRWQSGIAAMADVTVLAVLVLVLLLRCWRARPLAGALLVPYLAWVTFAAGLTLSLWLRNGRLLG